MSGFRTVQRTGWRSEAVSCRRGGRHHRPGGARNGDVTAEAPMIQAQSGERSFRSRRRGGACDVGQPELCESDRMVPGVYRVARGWRHAPRRRGSEQIMMDGILGDGHGQQRPDAPDEHRAIERSGVTQGYRPSSAVERLRSRRDQERTNRSWVALRHRGQLGLKNHRTNQENGIPKSERRTNVGSSIGGPVGKPGGSNKLFFFQPRILPSKNQRGAISASAADGARTRGRLSQSQTTTRDPIRSARSGDRDPYPGHGSGGAGMRQAWRFSASIRANIQKAENRITTESRARRTQPDAAAASVGLPVLAPLASPAVLGPA